MPSKARSAIAGPLLQADQDFVIADRFLVVSPVAVGLRPQKTVEPLQFLLGEIHLDLAEDITRLVNVAFLEDLVHDPQLGAAFDGADLGRLEETIAAEGVGQSIGFGRLGHIPGVGQHVAPADGGLAKVRVLDVLEILQHCLVHGAGLRRFLGVILVNRCDRQFDAELQARTLGDAFLGLLAEFERIAGLADVRQRFHAGDRQLGAVIDFQFLLRQEVGRHLFEDRPTLGLLADQQKSV